MYRTTVDDKGASQRADHQDDKIIKDGRGEKECSVNNPKTRVIIYVYMCVCV